MAITITNLRAEFALDSYKKVEIEFAGDGGETHGDKGRHNAESDAVKGNGNEFSFPNEDIDLHLTDSGILTVTAKVSKMLLPDKVIGEGKTRVEGGQQRVQLVDPKTGNTVGTVYFDINAKHRGGVAGAVAGATGHHGVGQQGSHGMTGSGMGTTGRGSGYGEQTGTLRDAGPVPGSAGGYSSGQQGQPGSGMVGGQQRYGQPGNTTSSGGIGGGQQGYGQPGSGGIGGGQSGMTSSGGIGGGQSGMTSSGGIGSGQQGYGQPGSTTSSGVMGSGQQGPGYGGGGQQTGMVQGQEGYGQEGNQQGRPQEFHEKRSHNVRDHDENESYTRDVC